MKKTIVSAMLLTAIASTSAIAQDVPKSNQTAPTGQQKTKIEIAQLPDAVKKTLASDTYKNWQPTAAWSVNATPPFYEIEAKMADKTNTLRIDSEGKVK